MLLCALALTLSTADRTVEKTEMMSDFAKKRLREAVKEAGKAPSPQERSKTMHMLMPIANHVATRLLYTEVAERARANPKAPGHQAMEHVLNSKKELSEIESSVKNKLVNIHSGAWAQEVCSTYPGFSACPPRHPLTAWFFLLTPHARSLPTPVPANMAKPETEIVCVIIAMAFCCLHNNGRDVTTHCASADADVIADRFIARRPQKCTSCCQRLPRRQPTRQP